MNEIVFEMVRRYYTHNEGDGLCCRLPVCLVCVRMAKHMRTVHHRLVGPFILVFQISTTFPKFYWDCEYKRSVEIWRFYCSCITDRVSNKRRSSCVDVATWSDFVCRALDRPSSVVAYCTEVWRVTAHFGDVSCATAHWADKNTYF